VVVHIDSPLMNTSFASGWKGSHIIRCVEI